MAMAKKASASLKKPQHLQKSLSILNFEDAEPDLSLSILNLKLKYAIGAVEEIASSEPSTYQLYDAYLKTCKKTLMHRSHICQATNS